MRERTYAATVLQLEGAVVLLTAAYAFHALGGAWVWFAVLFLVPDLSILGYLGGPRIGAVVYNVAHTYCVPFVLLLLWLIVPEVVMLRIVTIWVAHIGLDRMLGFGLKDATGFKHTHLQRV
ncbi:MAG: DUF4260 domain-containing protein [Gemmatimonadota bacterium]|jgi:hypothetical protein